MIAGGRANFIKKSLHKRPFLLEINKSVNELCLVLASHQKIFWRWWIAPTLLTVLHQNFPH